MLGHILENGVQFFFYFFRVIVHRNLTVPVTNGKSTRKGVSPVKALSSLRVPVYNLIKLVDILVSS